MSIFIKPGYWLKTRKKLKGAFNLDRYVDEKVTEKSIPVGGTSGQILSKIDDDDYNTEWKNEQDISLKADKSNVLELDNTTEFTPDADYEPATKKYVDDNASGGGSEFQIYNEKFSIDSSITTNWIRAIASSHYYLSEYYNSTGILSTDSMTSYSGADFRSSRPIGIATENQTVDSLFIANWGQFYSFFSRICILKLKWANNGVIDYVVELMNEEILFDSVPYNYTLTIPSTSFSEVSISKGDVLYMFVVSGNTNDMTPCEIHLKCLKS
jgi:hypothetical protein